MASWSGGVQEGRPSSSLVSYPGSPPSRSSLGLSYSVPASVGQESAAAGVVEGINPNRPPDMDIIPWYHFNISRHVAESLLISTGEDGSYLLRDSGANPGEFSLSVRSKDAVKHFTVRYDGESFTFGFGKFSTVQELLSHFESKPVIGGDSGILTVLKFPYPRSVKEPEVYDSIRVHAEGGTTEASQKPTFAIASKEGYLTKLGQHRKNWKTRWFVLYKNELSYYKMREDKTPLRVINMKDVSMVVADDSQFKNNCFKVVTSWRTFFLYATSAQEAEDWIKILRWKLYFIHAHPSSSIEIAMAVSAGYAAGSSERSTGGVYREKKASTLHREKELRSVIYNGSDSSEEEEEAMMSPMSLPNSSGQDRWHLGIESRIEHRQSLPFEVCRREDSNNLRSPPPLSTVSLQSSPLFTNSKLHQHFAATKLAKKTSAPNYMDIPWYHPKMSRHVAESMLLSKSTPEGTYLLRDSCSTENSLTLSVRSRDSIKHYRISWDGKHLSFGLGKFKNIPEFLEHFESQPIISGESGFLVYLSHPYPRCVTEFTDYEEPVIVEGPDGSTGSNGAPPTGTSRSGYLTKLGHHRKNWKLRWFRLFKSKLCYYTTKDSLVPLREIGMSDATSVQRDTSTGKDFCFKLETSYRTFYMYAQTEVEADEWVRLLRAKLDEKSKK